MASSSFSVKSPAVSVYSVTQTSSQFPIPTRSRRVSFRLSSKPKLRFLSKPSRSSYPVVKAQSNKVSTSASSKIDGSSAEIKEKNSLKDSPSSSFSSSYSSSPELATEEYISEFLTQVTTLVKLADTRYIVELPLKQLDCELVIREKEALPQPEAPAPYVMMQQPSQPSYVQSMAPPPAPAAASPAPSTQPPFHHHHPLLLQPNHRFLLLKAPWQAHSTVVLDRGMSIMV